MIHINTKLLILTYLLTYSLTDLLAYLILTYLYTYLLTYLHETNDTNIFIVTKGRATNIMTSIIHNLIISNIIQFNRNQPDNSI